MRPSNRKPSQLREITMEMDVNIHAEGCCLISIGNTKVMCTATVEEKVPAWMKNKGTGWITAEYGMLPRSTGVRMDREASKGKQSGRTLEISRLIGRSLRSVVNLKALGERTIWLDCDVLQADGGTRTAAITGAFVALHIALQKLMNDGKIKTMPIKEYLAAASCGIYGEDETPILDLDYEEDSTAIADSNFVMTESGGLVEVQSTAEANPITSQQFNTMMELAQGGIAELIHLQKQATGDLI